MVADLDTEYIRLSKCAAARRLTSYGLFQGRPLTTRGRWVNPVVFLFLKTLRSIPALRAVQKPLFIMGMGRSGTTILGQILSLHKDVAYINEPKAISFLAYPQEDVSGNYTQQLPARFILAADQATPAIIKTYLRIYSHFLSITQANRLIIKDPEIVFRVPYILKIFPDAKFIFLVRNGWDVSNSVAKWNKIYRQKMNGDIHDWWGTNDRKWNLLLNQLVSKDPTYLSLLKPYQVESDLERALVEWIVTMQEGIRQENLLPQSIYRIRYEDLVRNPEKELSDLESFCELSDDHNVLTYARGVMHPLPKYADFPVSNPALHTAVMNTLDKLGYGIE